MYKVVHQTQASTLDMGSMWSVIPCVFNLLDGIAMTRLLQETRSPYSTVHTTIKHNDFKPVGVTLIAKEPRGTHGNGVKR
jgi:hypothetical protein